MNREEYWQIVSANLVSGGIMIGLAGLTLMAIGVVSKRLGI